MLLFIQFFLRDRIVFSFFYFTDFHFQQMTALFFKLRYFFIFFYMKNQLIQIFKPIGKKLAISLSIFFKFQIEKSLFGSDLIEFIRRRTLIFPYYFILLYQYLFHHGNEPILVLYQILVIEQQIAYKTVPGSI